MRSTPNIYHLFLFFKLKLLFVEKCIARFHLTKMSWEKISSPYILYLIVFKDVGFA
jgi:hypothetical protein